MWFNGRMYTQKRISVPLAALFLAATLWVPGCSKKTDDPPQSPASTQPPTAPAAPLAVAGSYVGSASCRSCHEKFYNLWSTSHHGLAMQPYTQAFAQAHLTDHNSTVTIGKIKYQALRLDKNGKGLMRATTPDGKATDYPIEHVLGGKNVYYFLTKLAGGRLQTMPLEYDVMKKQWHDMAASAVRHFQGRAQDQALSWTDSAYTFNTSCFSCHVSQMDTNYDLKTNTYQTVWAEPGINCETCHGPAGEHVRLYRELAKHPKRKPPANPGLLSYKTLSVAQTNATCAPCHARMSPITTGFKPGEAYFDHYDLITFENNDFYPDGRDLGENYTETLWRTSPCVKSGKLKCTHCHTSSGRYRFADIKVANHACLPCHKARVANPTPHTHHKAPAAGKKSPRCTNCHMPTTRFARMGRSDHSMKPPTPAATMKFKSPNACTLCHKHKAKSPAWADKKVRQWHKEDYQAPVLQRAQWIDDARKQNWSKLDAMLTYLVSKERDEILTTSLVRLLSACPLQKKWPVMIQLLQHDASPLVRSAAATALAAHPTREAFQALLAACEDSVRLVRVRAASALAGFPQQAFSDKDRQRIARASREFQTSITSRPDHWSSHYNLANYLVTQNKPAEALKEFALAIRFRPDALMPYVNRAMLHAQMGESKKAEADLRVALKLGPKNAAVHFNLALLVAETGRLAEAEKHFRAALAADPKFANAAYNLAILLAKDRLPEAIPFAKQACTLAPDSPKYAYVYAFYLRQAKKTLEAIQSLRGIVEAGHADQSCYALLGAMHEQRGEFPHAQAVYRHAVTSARQGKSPHLTQRDAQFFQRKLRPIPPTPPKPTKPPKPQ